MKPTLTLLVGDVLDQLATLPDASAHCCVTSPPYWSLRDYGVEGQLGLEPTPEEYVARMVAVFREVRRVLRADGTLWLNIGDSYAGGGYANHAINGDDWYERATLDKRRNRQQKLKRACESQGIKPKDLVGIPWRLAQALQAPYYTGRISDERDRIWLAAMIDAEGCIHIHRRAAGTSAHSSYVRTDGTRSDYVRKQDTFGVMVSIDNTSEAIIDRCYEIIGKGSRYVHEKGTGKSRRKQTLYRLTLTGQQSRDLLRELYPYLVAKQREARIAYHSASSGEDAMASHEALKALHNGRDTTVDAPAPPSMFEPGWYLRCDVIWEKPNPMPESVTDRPTKAHEYVFLLAKSPRYFYDADAIREPLREEWSPNGKARTIRNGIDTNGGGQGNGSMGWNPSGRNKRSVWEIATEPFSARALLGDAPRTVSPDCPVHGDHPAPAPTAPDDAHAGDPSGRTRRSDARPGQEPLDGSAPTGPPLEPDSAADSSDSPELERSPAATPHSSGTRRTDRAPETSPACTPSAESPARTDDTSASRASAEQRPDTLASSISGVDWDAHLSDGTPADIADRCSCEPSLTDHFATFPTALVEPCVKAGCPEGGTVLDPFLGSGTTAAVALALGRSCVGIELNQDYARLAEKRAHAWDRKRARLAQTTIEGVA